LPFRLSGESRRESPEVGQDTDREQLLPTGEPGYLRKAEPTRATFWQVCGGFRPFSRLRKEIARDRTRSLEMIFAESPAFDFLPNRVLRKSNSEIRFSRFLTIA